MISIFRSFVRTTAFVGKEMVEILRQPRLVFTLILGPFLILLLFGLGYRTDVQTFRALFVASEDNPLRASIEEFAASLQGQLVYQGLTGDEADAMDRLRRNEVDVVVVAPENAYETIRKSEQAVFTLYHNELDPFQRSYVDYIGQIYIEAVNRRVLRLVAEEGQSEASSVQTSLSAARASVSALRDALQRGDRSAAAQHQRELDQNVGALEAAIGSGLGLLGGLQETSGAPGSAVSDELLASLAALRQNTDALDTSQSGSSDAGSAEQRLATIEEQLGALETRLDEFMSIDAVVLVSPFRTEAKGIAATQPNLTNYFAPGVIVLLLQHLAVTFAALSLVRDRRLGTIELFRVSPVAPAEILIGKYLSFLLFGGLLAAILSALLVFVLGVPMLGSWLSYALVIGLLLFAALGAGFVISLLAQTESQAVQYAMLVLLTSVFFSGFFLSLRLLWEGVRVVSWSLPATSANVLLQGIMLRGAPAHGLYLSVLAGLGVVFFLIAFLLLNRNMARR